MEFLTDLWLPILLSAVFVFIASSIFHMAIPIHKGDFKKLPGEEKVLDVLRAQGLQPGEYMFPCADSMKDMGTPEMIEKYRQGPVGFTTIVPNGPFNMGKCLTQWFVYLLLVSLFTAYVARHALADGASYLAVFRLAGTIAVVAYALYNIPNSIWKGVPWSVTAKFVFEGIVYGLLTAGTFGWLWPHAAA